jgi:glucokinase
MLLAGDVGGTNTWLGLWWSAVAAAQTAHDPGR